MIFVMSLVCFIAGCTFDAPPPPRTPGSSPPPVIERSSVATPVSITQEPVRAELEKLLKAAPLGSGQTDEVDARALVNERTIIQEPRQIVEVPYRAAYCQINKVERQVRERVKTGVEAYGCWLQPWEWGKCWRDVFQDVVRTVVDDVKQCFPEQLEVVKTVVTPVVHLKEAALPTKVRIRYNLELEHLDLSMSGSRLNLKPRVRVTVQADLRQGVLGSSVLIRGALQCVSVLTPTVAADLTLMQKGGVIGVAANVVSASIDIHQLCVPGAVEAIDLALLADPVKGLIVREFTGKLNKELPEILQKEIGGGLSSVNLAESLRKLTDPARAPVELAPDIWLEPRVEGLEVSQLVGGHQHGVATFDITGALTARPRVTYGALPEQGALPSLPVSIGASGDRFHLEPVGVVWLADARAQMERAIAQFLAQQPTKYRDIKYDVDLYQSHARMVVALKLHKPGLFGWRATVYLAGQPAFDAASNRIVLQDLKFDLASRNIILKVASWLLDSKVEEYLQAQARFPVDAQLARALTELAHFRSESPSGVFSGGVDRLELGKIWLANNALNFSVIAEGNSRFDARLAQ